LHPREHIFKSQCCYLMARDILKLCTQRKGQRGVNFMSNIVNQIFEVTLYWRLTRSKHGDACEYDFFFCFIYSRLAGWCYFILTDILKINQSLSVITLTLVHRKKGLNYVNPLFFTVWFPIPFEVLHYVVITNHIEYSHMINNTFVQETVAWMIQEKKKTVSLVSLKGPRQNNLLKEKDSRKNIVPWNDSTKYSSKQSQNFK